MIALPGRTPATVPSRETTATVVSDMNHVTARSDSGVPLAATTVAVSRWLPPMRMTAESGSRRTAAAVTGAGSGALGDVGTTGGLGVGPGVSLVHPVYSTTNRMAAAECARIW